MRGARRPAAHQPAVRDPRRRGRRDDSHRAHRAGLREDRHASRRRCSAGSCTRRCSGCRPTCPIRCRRTFALRLELPSRHAALLGDALSAGRRADRRAERFATPAQRRLIFEEAFLFQMGVLARRAVGGGGAQAGADRGRRSHPRVGAARAAVQADGRAEQALKEIVDDMQRPQPMNRLLQGDVGAGKTIVALLAALVAMENGLQVAFMAPTEILAEQHFANIARLLAAVALPRRAADRHARRGRASARAARRDRSAARSHLVVGTHALVQERRRVPAARAWSSSTSSTASACCSARRCARKGCIPTCW